MIKCYKVYFPDEVEYLQRRDSFRLRISAAMNKKVACTYAGHKMELSIKDISTSGIAFVCPKEDKDIFEVRSTIHGCELETDDGDSIVFDFVVYRIKENAKSISICGRMVYNDLEHKKILTRYITQLDREVRRKDSAHNSKIQI